MGHKKLADVGHRKSGALQRGRNHPSDLLGHPGHHGNYNRITRLHIAGAFSDAGSIIERRRIAHEIQTFLRGELADAVDGQYEGDIMASASHIGR